MQLVGKFEINCYKIPLVSLFICFQILSFESGKVLRNVGREFIKITLFSIEFKALSNVSQLGCEHVLWSAKRSNYDIFSHCPCGTYALQLHLCDNRCHFDKVDFNQRCIHLDDNDAIVRHRFDGCGAGAFDGQKKAKIDICNVMFCELLH